MIEKETIEEILSATKIEEVLGDYLVMKKRGINYEACCPFHNEKTPSFKISPVKGIFKCFGCGKSGNVVKFIMEHEKFTYPEALRMLAQRVNIIIPENNTYENSDNYVSKTVLGAMELASNIFKEELMKDSASDVFKYIKSRGISNESISKFKLGYSPNFPKLVSDKLKEYDYDNFILEKSGLSILHEGNTYDRFRGRLIFPIFNLSDKVIAFGGRILIDDKKKAKYINSPETELYNKSKVLYGLNFAKKSILKEDMCYLVEGYTDVIMLHQIGIENVVASSGTSLTIDQIRLISRYTKNITILYDGDVAGIKASFRGIDMILEEDMNVKIVLFPDGEDPDSFSRKNNKDYVIDFITSNSINFIIYKTNILKDDFIEGSDIVKKTDAINEIVSTISKVSDVIMRDIYVKECSKILKIKESIINDKIEDLILKSKNKKSYFKKTTEIIYGSNAEKDIIRLLLNYGNEYIEIDAINDEKEHVLASVPLAVFIIFDIRNDDLLFEDKLYQDIFDEYESLIKSNKIVPENYFTNHHNKSICDFACSIIDIPITISKSWDGDDVVNIKKIAIKSLLLFKFKIIEKKIEVNNIEIANSTNDNVIIELLKKRELLISGKKEIHKQLKTN